VDVISLAGPVSRTGAHSDCAPDDGRRSLPGAGGVLAAAWESATRPCARLQLGVIGQIPDVLSSVGLSYGGEIVYKGRAGICRIRPSCVSVEAEVFGQDP